METTQILDLVEQILGRIVKNPGLVLKPEYSHKDVAGWDSLAHIMLISALGKHFGVKFTTAEMLKMNTVANICAVINSKKS